MFSHLYVPSRVFQPLPQISEVEAPRPQVQPQEPLEMDAVESEFNRWNHEPMRMVGEVPHRWEKSLGTSRMFFDAKAELMLGRKRRSVSGYTYCPEQPQQERKTKRLIADSLRPLSSDAYSGPAKLPSRTECFWQPIEDISSIHPEISDQIAVPVSQHTALLSSSSSKAAAAAHRNQEW